MSRIIPTQFESYGLTFWIPSVVEPTVGMIGTSLPAFRMLFKKTAEKVSTGRISGGGSGGSSRIRAKMTAFGSGPIPFRGRLYSNINDSDIELRAVNPTDSNQHH